MNNRPLIPGSVIALELSERAEELVRDLFPDAQPQGRELRWHGRGGAVCSMVIRGGKTGVWCNWTDDRERGDALELVHHTLFPDEAGRGESIRWAQSWLGIEPLTENAAAALALAARARMVQALARQAQQAANNRDQMVRHAIAIYLDEKRSQPVPLSPEIASYLLGRGVPLDDLASVPRSLRFSARKNYGANLMLPAMLAPIITPEGGRYQHTATHVTFLGEGNDGVWRKAGVDPAKKCYGAYRGGVIPLLRGRSGKSLADAPEGDAVLIAEGIENALAASLCVDDEPRVVACVSVGNLPNIALPPTIKTVFLALDRDGENEGVRTARNKARKRFTGEGRNVEMLTPPAGVKDFSDYLLDPQWAALNRGASAS